MSEPNVDNLVSAGLDVGSQNARIFISNSTSQQPSIVPNEIGQRYSLALSTPEPDIETDPVNDQFWVDSKKKKKKDIKQAKVVHYLYGDAARKSLQRLKKPLAPHIILNMVQEEDFVKDDTDSMISCESYFQHLTNLTTNASHTSPQNLRLVLSTTCPPTEETDVSSSSPLTNLTSSIQKGILKSIVDEVGYKKSDKKQIFGEKRILAVLTHPVAIAHANKLFESSQPLNRDVLIVDWGASALSLSHLSITAGIAQVKTHVCEQSLSGKNIINLLVKHIAELFERKNRCIPAGETISNKKARAKLEVAAEDALRSFGFSQKVTVTVDGLIEGIDCHVDVMLARFEMLLGNILRGAEGKLKQFGTFDSVIGAGSVMRMKCVEKMLDRLYPRGQVFRGESVNDVPPEEAVAMGCAMYGSTLLSSSLSFPDEEEKESEDEGVQGVQLEEEVPLCPVSIGLSFVEGDPAAHILIQKGSPLPVLVTKMLEVNGCSSNSIDIVQINDGEKTVGRIEGIDVNATKEVEFTMELSVNGKLSVAVNGGLAMEI